MSGVGRVRAAFAGAAGDGRVALICYVVAGYPSEGVALAAAEAALDAGADILEVGVPFSDPVADGPVIAEAGRAAVAAGSGWASALRLVAMLRDRGRRQPVLAMSYLNPMLAGAGRRALDELVVAGADGCIVPDLPPGEEPGLEAALAERDLAIPFLVAPNTAAERLALAAEHSTGFLYVVPLLGVTGARQALAAGALPLLARARAAAAGRLPTAAGFGISSPAHVRALRAAVDGVVVGSALVAALRDAPAGGGAAAVGSLVGSLVAAARPAALA